jgi:hypothetical protein
MLINFWLISLGSILSVGVREWGIGDRDWGIGEIGEWGNFN